MVHVLHFIFVSVYTALSTHPLIVLLEIVSAAVSNAASALLKRLWSLKSTPKTGIVRPTLMPFDFLDILSS